MFVHCLRWVAVHIPEGYTSVLTVYTQAKPWEVRTPSKRPYLDRLKVVDPFQWHESVALSQVASKIF